MFRFQSRSFFGSPVLDSRRIENAAKGIMKKIDVKVSAYILVCGLRIKSDKANNISSIDVRIFLGAASALNRFAVNSVRVGVEGILNCRTRQI